MKLGPGCSFILYLLSDDQLTVDHCRKFGELRNNSMGQKNDFPSSRYLKGKHFVFCMFPSRLKFFPMHFSFLMELS